MFGGRKRAMAPVLVAERPVAHTWLMITLTLVVLPHLTRMPLWITLVVGCLGVLRLLHDRLQWRLPPRWATTLLAPGLLIGAMASFGVTTGQRVALAFLTMLLGLKLLETRTQRDVMVLSFIGYFLIMTNFLYAQSLPMILYLMASVWLLTITVIHFQHLGDVTPVRLRINLRQSSLLLVQALPMMVLLFMFFPRLHGPLWGWPRDGASGVTGFSDHMSPGDLSNLSRSSEVAFRVEFAETIPPPEQQYWRGLVLWDYDGRTWRQGPGLPPRAIRWRQTDTSYTYTITLEPHGQLWLFSLELPYAFVRHQQSLLLAHTGRYIPLGWLTSDLQLRARRPVRQVQQYTLQSYAHHHTGELSDMMRYRALRIPANLQTRVRHLAHEWRQASRSDQEVMQRALRYFREQDFVYTLNPPLLGNAPTAEFLFETRRGYCEHFASSFTMLMRAAGIPARVVVGYQGGERNPLGQHLTIRQSNAHAWSEVWLPTEGWMRVDPTAAVAPDRIALGPEALPELSPIPRMLRYTSWLQTLWRTTRMSWDALHYAWNRWVVDYSVEQQTNLLARLGLERLTWQGLALLVVVLLGTMMAFFALPMLRQRPPRDRIVRAYHAFCAKLARRGITRQLHEGPLDFAQRVQQQRPELAAQVERISRLYSALRYGARQHDTDIKRLQDAVRTFRP